MCRVLTSFGTSTAVAIAALSSSYSIASNNSFFCSSVIWMDPVSSSTPSSAGAAGADPLNQPHQPTLAFSAFFFSFSLSTKIVRSRFFFVSVEVIGTYLFWLSLCEALILRYFYKIEYLRTKGHTPILPTPLLVQVLPFSFSLPYSIRYTAIFDHVFS